MEKPTSRVHFGEVRLRLLRFFGTFFIFLTVLIIASIIIIIYLYRWIDSPPINRDPTRIPIVAGVDSLVNGTTIISIKQGETAESVGLKLKESGLIRSIFFWNLLARIDSATIKAGTFQLQAGASSIQIREILVLGKQLMERVTIPEGFTLKKIAELLERNGIVDSEDFLVAVRSPGLLQSYGIPATSLEGYLFPDTYFFPRDYPTPMVIKTMLDTFYRRLYEIAPEARIISQKELFEKIIIASIVEREYRADDEAPLMAGVFFNRLKIGMALQSCATVEYVITEIQGKPHPEVLYNKDIEIKDLFNTYMYAGLPPGPISSPGITALKSAFNPIVSDYLYFRLVDPSEGRHQFSRTLGEHAEAGILYLKSDRTGK